MEGFNKLSSLPSIQGQLTLYEFIFKSLLKVIIISSNPRHIVCSCKQLLILWKKKSHFNASGFATDAKVLWLSLIYWKATLGYLFHKRNSQKGIKLYVIEDKGYSLLPWWIIPYKQIGMWHFMLKAFTIGSFHARITIKNNFGILKKMFREFFIKSNLNVLFLLDVVICCGMLHDMILNGKDQDVDELMLQLEIKNVPKNKKGVEMGNFDQGVWGDEVNELDVEFAL